MNLSCRLRLYIRLFAKRPDVHVWDATWSDVSAVPELPSEASFLGEQSVRFVWGFEEGSADAHPSAEGGVLHLHPGHDQDDGWRDAERFPLDGVEKSLMLDCLVEEATTHLVAAPGQSVRDAVPAFYNANDESVRRFDSLESYLTLGARRAFAWYWPNEDQGETDEVLARLNEGSLAADAGLDAVRAGLLAQGASPNEADALLAWLGHDARILVPVNAATERASTRPPSARG